MHRSRVNRAVFLDKDGTLVEDVPYNVDPARLRFTPHAGEGLRRLVAAGYLVIVITNQPGVALGLFDAVALERLAQALSDRLRVEGVELSGFYACPHAEGPPDCGCRKPAPGLLLQAAQEHQVDLSASWMIGDILNDVEAGRRAGCRTVLLDVGHETVWDLSPLRRPLHRVADLRAAAQAILEDASAAPQQSASSATPGARAEETAE